MILPIQKPFSPPIHTQEASFKKAPHQSNRSAVMSYNIARVRHFVI